MTFESIIKKAAKELDLPEKVVKDTYIAYWSYIRQHIQELPLKDCTEDEFLNLRVNFNIPSLGKLNCTYDRILGIRNKYKKFKDA